MKLKLYTNPYDPKRTVVDDETRNGEAAALNHLIELIESYDGMPYDRDLFEVLQRQARAMGWPEPEVLES